MINLCLKKYYSLLEKIWQLQPIWLRPYIICLSVFIFGITVKGDWIFIMVHILRQFGNDSQFINALDSFFPWKCLTLEYFRLQNLPIVWLSCMSVGFGIWVVVGGFLQWYFYFNQHDQPEEWKCQPKRWLTPEQERSEFLWGCVGLATTNTGSAVITAYILNGGYSTLYYNISDYSLLWYIMQWPALFFCQDYFTYWAHRIYHMPFLYPKFHKLHHQYKAPTCWSVTAFHPFEIFTMQLVLAAPLVYLPMHWTTFIVIGLYTYYNAILDHSGVDIKAPWWQFWKPDSIFHDNHHQYTHVNFGFNCFFWDVLHGTYRKTNCIYREDIFYGYGKLLTEISKDELQREIEERMAENPKSHRELRKYLLK